MDELLRQAEECLSGTIQLALAADQRGTTTTGILGAGTVALLAAAATIGDGRPALLAALLATSAVLFLAALLCAWSSRPTDFYIGGYEPKLLSQCGGDLIWMKRCSTADVQNRISTNRKFLELSSRVFIAAVMIAAFSPFVGIGTYFFWIDA